MQFTLYIDRLKIIFQKKIFFFSLEFVTFCFKFFFFSFRYWCCLKLFLNFFLCSFIFFSYILFFLVYFYILEKR